MKLFEFDIDISWLVTWLMSLNLNRKCLLWQSFLDYQMGYVYFWQFGRKGTYTYIHNESYTVYSICVVYVFDMFQSATQWLFSPIQASFGFNIICSLKWFRRVWHWHILVHAIEICEYRRQIFLAHILYSCIQWNWLVGITQLYSYVTTRTLRWQWTIHHLKIYFLLKIDMFQCHISFHGCMYNQSPPAQTSLYPSSRLFPMRQDTIAVASCKGFFNMGRSQN